MIWGVPIDLLLLLGPWAVACVIVIVLLVSDLVRGR